MKPSTTLTIAATVLVACSPGVDPDPADRDDGPWTIHGTVYLGSQPMRGIAGGVDLYTSDGSSGWVAVPQTGRSIDPGDGTFEVVTAFAGTCTPHALSIRAIYTDPATGVTINSGLQPVFSEAPNPCRSTAPLMADDISIPAQWVIQGTVYLGDEPMQDLEALVVLLAIQTHGVPEAVTQFGGTVSRVDGAYTVQTAYANTCIPGALQMRAQYRDPVTDGWVNSDVQVVFTDAPDPCFPAVPMQADDLVMSAGYNPGS